jgi:uncharacterized protein with WD repeat
MQPTERTIEEIKEKLRQLDELTILEVLDITSEELVEFLTDQIIERYDEITEYLEDDEEE